MTAAPAKYHNPARHADVIERAAKVTYYTVEAITGPGRWSMLCEVRFAIMHVLAGLGLSPDAIGQLLKRDRTTVLHGLARAADLSVNDGDFRLLIKAIS